MADIDIVHKKRTSVWLWVALAIIALAVLFLLFGMAGELAQAPDGAAAAPPPVATPSAGTMT